MTNKQAEQVAEGKRKDTRVLHKPIEKALKKAEKPGSWLQASLPDQAWAELQWGGIDLGDRRLTERAVEWGARMAAVPNAQMPRQAKNRAMLVGGYRLMNNSRVSMTKLLAKVYATTRQEAGQHEVVLLIQDGTELDFSAHQQTGGLGSIGDGRGQGLMLHSMLAVLPDTRQVLGLAHSQVYLREKHAKKRKDRRRSAEARVWEVEAHAIGKPPPGVKWVYVSDRESDEFEYLSACLEEGCEFVVRAQHNRVSDETPRVVGQKRAGLLDGVRRWTAQPGSEYTVTVDATKKQAARKAHLVLAWGSVTIPMPQSPPPDQRAHAPISAWAVRAWEPNPPAGVEPVEWILLSSLAVTTLPQAQRTVAWYTCRWLCEDYHQCLKTGCLIEHTQLDDASDIQRLLGFKIPIAVRLLQLRQLTRNSPDGLARQLVDPLFVRIAAHLQQGDAASMSMAEFWINVAKTGGYQGRRNDGPPGWRTLWAGWSYISQLATGARLFAPQ